jgi:2-polyprenyl-3-methyl-5-hydroxy-6-metoxy-1,4-benzoquinol methylase
LTHVPTNWKRTLSFQPRIGETYERWECVSDGQTLSFDVNISHSKAMDTLALKEKVIAEFGNNAEKIRKRGEYIFAKTALERVIECPICSENSESSRFQLSVYGGKYHECQKCFHVFVIERPNLDAIHQFYESNEEYQATYADSTLLELRMDTVARPKLNWVLEAYHKQYDRYPTSLLDVGAGSGHMAQAAKERGLRVDAIEISRPGRDFAKSNFGIELQSVDFLRADIEHQEYDVVTFWGVIEHVPNPGAMLQKAVQHLKKNSGMVVAEVPRWHSLSSAIQKLYPEKIVRHLVPSEHIQFYSDSSLATNYVLSNLQPASAWYFGMDIYEAIAQFSHEYGAEPDGGAEYIRHFQPLLDSNRLSDFVVLAGVPLS